ncbi:MAG: peptidylprolyl isomerase [Planctomycetota bacterium]
MNTIRRPSLLFTSLLIISAFSLAGCWQDTATLYPTKQAAGAPPGGPSAGAPKPIKTPGFPGKPAGAGSTVNRVVATEIIIAFKDVNPKAARSKEEAESLAKEIYQKINAPGAPKDTFATLRKQSDAPGTGMLAIFQGTGRKLPTDVQRSSLAPALGEAAFLLKTGEVKLIPYDPAKSPEGWRIVKRLE